MFNFDYSFASYNPNINTDFITTSESNIDIDEIWLNFNTLQSFASYLPYFVSITTSSSFIPVNAFITTFSYSYSGIIPVWLGSYQNYIWTTVGYDNLFPITVFIPHFGISFRIRIRSIIHDVENYNTTEEKRTSSFPLMYKTKKISKKLVFIDGEFYYKDFYDYLDIIKQNVPWELYFLNTTLTIFKKELKIDMNVGIGTGIYPYMFIVPFKLYGYV